MITDYHIVKLFKELPDNLRHLIFETWTETKRNCCWRHYWRNYCRKLTELAQRKHFTQFTASLEFLCLSWHFVSDLYMFLKKNLKCVGLVKSQIINSNLTNVCRLPLAMQLCLRLFSSWFHSAVSPFPSYRWSNCAH